MAGIVAAGVAFWPSGVSPAKTPPTPVRAADAGAVWPADPAFTLDPGQNFAVTDPTLSVDPGDPNDPVGDPAASFNLVAAPGPFDPTGPADPADPGDPADPRDPPTPVPEPSGAAILALALSVLMTLRSGQGDRKSARPRSSGAAQAIVDRSAETVLGDRHHCDPGEIGPVEPAQHREQIGRGLGEIAAAAEP